MAEIVERALPFECSGTRSRAYPNPSKSNPQECHMDTLTATITEYIIRVDDEDGGAWFPSAEAEAEIRAAADPFAAAINICWSAPMRGTWRN